MIKNKFLVFIVFLLLVFTGCGARPSDPTNAGTVGPENLTVSAAVSLKDAFGEIGELYKSKTGVAVSFNFGASGALEQQIEYGAPVDVFASAGEKQMDDLAAKGKILDDSRRDFAGNELVLIVPRDTRLNLDNFDQLAAPAVQKLAVGNPKTVPAGQYAEQLLERSGLKTAVASKLIFAEDVRHVLDYIVRGEADAGIVYATDARMSGDGVRVAAVAAKGMHEPILYPIAIVRDTAKKQAAAAFVDLVLSDEGRAILQKFGFAAPR